ncbi:MAG TPA: hypothetical protein VF045_02310 [Acidimicrobiales bacterium]
MLVALLIPLVGIAVGLGLWALLRGVNAFNVPDADPSGSYGGGGGRVATRSSGTWAESRGGSVRERIDALPQGCLIGVIVVAALWILGWIVVLLIGLSLLS